jgi:hypothetical protein
MPRLFGRCGFVEEPAHLGLSIARQSVGGASEKIAGVGRVRTNGFLNAYWKTY